MKAYKICKTHCVLFDNKADLEECRFEILPSSELWSSLNRRLLTPTESGLEPAFSCEQVCP